MQDDSYKNNNIFGRLLVLFELLVNYIDEETKVFIVFVEKSYKITEDAWLDNEMNNEMNNENCEKDNHLIQNN